MIQGALQETSEFESFDKRCKLFAKSDKVHMERRFSAMTVYDEVVVTVNEPDTVTVLSPNGGEVWQAGTTQYIRWTTTGVVADVRIDYSTDNGQTWKSVVASVGINSPDWLNYPWVVPNDPSTQCLVMLSGYFGGTSTISASTFTITP